MSNEVGSIRDVAGQFDKRRLESQLARIIYQVDKLCYIIHTCAEQGNFNALKILDDFLKQLEDVFKSSIDENVKFEYIIEGKPTEKITQLFDIYQQYALKGNSTALKTMEDFAKKLQDTYETNIDNLVSFYHAKHLARGIIDNVLLLAGGKEKVLYKSHEYATDFDRYEIPLDQVKGRNGKPNSQLAVSYPFAFFLGVVGENNCNLRIEYNDKSDRTRIYLMKDNVPSSPNQVSEKPGAFDHMFTPEIYKSLVTMFKATDAKVKLLQLDKSINGSLPQL